MFKEGKTMTTFVKFDQARVKSYNRASLVLTTNEAKLVRIHSNGYTAETPRGEQFFINNLDVKGTTTK
jgi:hypothetical protein